ncbi:HLA class II histocompatibility antigen, DM beta chain-like [Gavia stellata]|uniref:HLA class II histocompatibility antigen, DM beta chain-like n=1 Tax=Gavia stellata TaxID=37040 RepID=UPI00289855B4|nr:HLA class II histocompatibility antigen, DM beta chain-like [Gavia stellata]
MKAGRCKERPELARLGRGVGGCPTPGDRGHPRVPLVGAFLVHVASSCPLAANGSAVAFDFTLIFNKNPLVCYHPDARRFLPCDWGLLHGFATLVAAILNNGTAWAQRAEAWRWACRDLATHFWASTALRRTPPQVRIVPVPLANAPDSVLLTCHVWGFYPPEVTVIWLHNGDIVATGDTAKILPNGDWTYQTQVTLRVTAKVGDTFTCSVQHASLDRHLRKNWGPGLSPGLTAKVVAAAVIMTLGLVVFAAGTFCYFHQAPDLVTVLIVVLVPDLVPVPVLVPLWPRVTT